MFVTMNCTRRDARVVELARLESVCGSNITEGSNPSLSASNGQISKLSPVRATILGKVSNWRDSTTALEPILAQKPERRAGRRPAQPKNPPPFALFFRDFPRRDFLEAEKGGGFSGFAHRKRWNHLFLCQKYTVRNSRATTFIAIVTLCM